MSENTYTMQEIKRALEQTNDIIYPEAYIGDQDFKFTYGTLRKFLVRNKRNSLVTYFKNNPK